MKVSLLLFLCAASLPSLNFAKDAPGALDSWWQGRHGAGDLLGVRPELEDRGIDLSGKWIGTFYGVVSGGLEQRGAFDQSLHFDLKVDFEKLTSVEGLKGLAEKVGVADEEKLDLEFSAFAEFHSFDRACADGVSFSSLDHGLVGFSNSVVDLSGGNAFSNFRIYGGERPT